MHGLLRCNINAGVHARGRSERVIQRCHNSPRWETWLGSANDVMHQKYTRRILGDLKKSVELRTRHRTRRVDFWGSQRPDEFARYGRRTRWGGVGADGKARIERMCISLLMSKNLLTQR